MGKKRTGEERSLSNQKKCRSWLDRMEEDGKRMQTERDQREENSGEDKTPGIPVSLMWPVSNEQQGQRDGKCSRGMNQESESIASALCA